MLPTSLLIADTIKTLDFSMPSYNDISDAKASVETVKSLSVPSNTKAAPAIKSSGTKKLAPSAKKQAATAAPAKTKGSTTTVKYEF